MRIKFNKYVKSSDRYEEKIEGAIIRGALPRDRNHRQERKVAIGGCLCIRLPCEEGACRSRPILRAEENHTLAELCDNLA